MTNGTSPSILQDIENALQEAQTVLPTLIGIVGAFYTPAQALVPFLPLLQTALSAVEQVAKATGQNIATSTQEVVNTLTPGAPNSSTLTAAQ